MEILVKFGQQLRALSLSGGAGNLAAWVVVLGLSLLPGLGLLWKGRQRADLLLALAGGEAFAWLYFLVNPTLLEPALRQDEMWALCGLTAVTGTVAAWVLLRLLAALEKNSSAGLLPGLLRASGVLYALFATAAKVQTLLAKTAEVTAGNTGAPETAQFTNAVLGMLSAASLVPSLLGGLVLWWAGRLVEALDNAPFGEETVALAERLAVRCAWVVRASLLMVVGCNLLQMALFKALASMSFTVYVPLVTLGLCGALSLLCRYFRKAKAVSDDNDSII